MPDINSCLCQRFARIGELFADFLEAGLGKKVRSLENLIEKRVLKLGLPVNPAITYLDEVVAGQVGLINILFELHIGNTRAAREPEYRIIRIRAQRFNHDHRQFNCSGVRFGSGLRDIKRTAHPLIFFCPAGDFFRFKLQPSTFTFGTPCLLKNCRNRRGHYRRDNDQTHHESYSCASCHVYLRYTIFVYLRFYCNYGSLVAQFGAGFQKKLMLITMEAAQQMWK